VIAGGSYHQYVMAVERVERRLKRVAAALNAAGVRYAVIGGNAVAAWVAKADASATRSTIDVDLLIDRPDLDAVTQVFEGLGFKRHDRGRVERAAACSVAPCGRRGPLSAADKPRRYTTNGPALMRFSDPDEPSRRSGVHLVWAGQKVLPSYAHPTPSVKEAVFDKEHGFWLLELAALVRMKLTSFRDIDRVHVADLLSVGLIDDAVRASLPADFLERLRTVEATVEPME